MPILFRLLNKCSLLATLLLLAPSCQRSADQRPAAVEEALGGTNLFLQGKVGQVSVYGPKPHATDGLEEHSLAVFNGHEPIVTRFLLEDNHIETTHFELGLPVLVTRKNAAGAIIERTFSALDASGSDTFIYIDKDGNGEWDIMVDMRHPQPQKFIRQGQQWIQSKTEKTETDRHNP